ncbi:MAG: hypothetical protein NTV30_02415, partial [Chloroflexi bacterium]|nr:hypothetical protein [Chloroflexota bacterium]
ATIKAHLGITATLKKGHDAIFEVSINDKVLYTNNKTCGTFPEEKEIIQKIEGYKSSGLIKKKPKQAKQEGNC